MIAGKKKRIARHDYHEMNQRSGGRKWVKKEKPSSLGRLFTRTHV